MGSFLPILLRQNRPSSVPQTWHGSCYTPLRHREYRMGPTDGLLHGAQTSHQNLLWEYGESREPSETLVKAQGSNGFDALETARSNNGPASWRKPLWFRSLRWMETSQPQKPKDGRGRVDGEGRNPQGFCGPDIPPTVRCGNAGNRRCGRREGFEGYGRTRGDGCFATAGNAVNPRIGSRVKHLCRLWEEKAVGPVKNRRGGTRESICNGSFRRKPGNRGPGVDSDSSQHDGGASLENPREAVEHASVQRQPYERVGKDGAKD